MGIRVHRHRSSISALGLLCAGLLAASLAFGQEQPPQQNRPARGEWMMQQQAPEGPVTPGMPGPGMMRGMARPGRMQRMMPGMGEPGAMRRMPRMGAPEPLAGLLRRPDVQKELGITPEQLQKLDEIRFNSQKETIQHRSALQISRLELQRLISAENPDRAAIDKKIQETAQEEAALMRTSINARLNERGVLTAEQRTKLKQFMENRMAPGGAQGAGAGRPARKAGERTPAPAPPPKPPGN